MAHENNAQEKKIFLQGPVGKLEALIKVPAQAKKIVGVICHPHPLYGGTMYNKVITTLARTFFELDITSIRFNYRGVGNSDGSYDEGRGETADVLAVIAWAKQQWPDYTLWLAGFSFGAYVSLNAAHQLNAAKAQTVQQLISIAPAVQHANFQGLHPHCPWLVLQGEKDEVVPATYVIDWVKTLQPPPQLLLFPEASHFFDGQLITLRQWLIQVLMPQH